MADRYLDWLEGAQAKRPDLKEQLHKLGELYQKKLWHQLTLELQQNIESPAFRKDANFLPELYSRFIVGFSHRLNPLKVAMIAEVVAKRYREPGDAESFLNDVISQMKETKQLRLEQPLLYLQLQIARIRLENDDAAGCASTIDDGKEELEAMQDVDPAVSASFYFIKSLLHKQEQNFAEFYKSSLMYLAFISSDTLPKDTKLSLAVDISLAALLGEDVYNFGELLLHPLIEVLQDSAYAWLLQMLHCFNNGDMHKYDQLCSEYASVLNSLPSMVANERMLRQKITILALTELIFNLPAEKRTIPLSDIAVRTKLDKDGVEFLLMKALSLNLIKGRIDEVQQTVQVTWVQARVLTKPQIGALNERLGGWISKVSGASKTLEAESMAITV